MLVAATFDKFSKVHKGPRRLRVLSKYDSPKLEANVRLRKRWTTKDDLPPLVIIYDCPSSSTANEAPMVVNEEMALGEKGPMDEKLRFRCGRTVELNGPC